MEKTKYEGKKHHSWKGGNRIYRKRALQHYELKCVKCNSQNRLVVHHKDKNRLNGELTNLVILCGSCHSKEHRPKSIIKCQICGLKKPNHAKGLCKECYNEKWEKENKEKHLKTSREWKKRNYKWTLIYKKWHRGYLKEKPKLGDYK